MKHSHRFITRQTVRIRIFLLVLGLLSGVRSFSQQMHEEVADYSVNGTPVNGIKIKTNLPFTNSSQMPTVHLYGYNYVSSDVIDLSIVYYIYGSVFLNYSATTNSAFAPTIKLASEDGKVVIFLDNRSYFQRFTVSVYGKGMSAESTPAYYEGWTVADEALTGTNVVTVPYKKAVAGNLTLPGGIWNSAGKVGIGTAAPTEALTVNGKIKTKEVNVTTSGWADDVFSDGYPLATPEQLEAQIKQLGHLPGIPSTKQVEDSGLDLGEMNKKLLRKIEELTLYIIDQNKRIDRLESKAKPTLYMIEQQKQIDSLSRLSRELQYKLSDEKN